MQGRTGGKLGVLESSRGTSWTVLVVGSMSFLPLAFPTGRPVYTTMGNDTSIYRSSQDGSLHLGPRCKRPTRLTLASVRDRYPLARLLSVLSTTSLGLPRIPFLSSPSHINAGSLVVQASPSPCSTQPLREAPRRKARLSFWHIHGLMTAGMLEGWTALARELRTLSRRSGPEGGGEFAER